MAAAGLRSKGWLTVTEAARRAGLTPYRVEQLVATGAVARFTTPGTNDLVLWPDVERAVAAAPRPAQAAAESLDATGWIPLKTAARRAELSVYRIERMIALGAVASFQTPGAKPLVSWPDVARVLAAAIRPARDAAEGPSEAGENSAGENSPPDGDPLENQDREGGISRIGNRAPWGESEGWECQRRKTSEKPTS